MSSGTQPGQQHTLFTFFRLVLCTWLLLNLPLTILYAQTDEASDSAQQEETYEPANDSTEVPEEQEEEPESPPETDQEGRKDEETDKREASVQTHTPPSEEVVSEPAPEPPQGDPQVTSQSPALQPVANGQPERKRAPRTPKAPTSPAVPKIQAQQASPEPIPEPAEAESVHRPSPEEKDGTSVTTKEESDEFFRELIAFEKHLSPWMILLIVSILVLIYFVNMAITLYFGKLSAKKAEYSRWFKKGIPFITFSLWVITFFLLAVIVAPTRVTTALLIGILIAMTVFSSHQLMRDFIAGLMILLERPFQIGDRIQIGDHYGEVVRIGLRSFHVRSPEGSLVVIPNGEIMANAVANMNPGTMEGQVITELYMPSDMEIDEARRIAFEAAAVSPYVFIHRPIEVYVDEEYKEQLLIKVIVKAFVFDAKYENDLRSDIVELARKGFRKPGRSGEHTRSPKSTPLPEFTSPGTDNRKL